MHWYEIKDSHKILSPSLVFYPDRIANNIDKMIEIAGTAERLRPHVKTYKMPEIVQMQLDKGITKFKCATLVEAKMLADVGATDILLAMPIIGPNQPAFLQLKSAYTDITFSTLIDSVQQTDIWAAVLNESQQLNLYADLNVGMHRTGILPEKALPLINKIQEHPKLNLKGLHAYDGHIRISDVDERNRASDEAFEAVDKLISNIDSAKNLELVCGGSVTFMCHARDGKKTLSPGTTLLWDAGYGSSFPDIPIQHAATLITRIISKPGDDRICLDLGHKAVASEMQNKRVHFPQLEDYSRVGHSEEHLVLQVKNRDQWKIGDVLYGIPWHICPTVALHHQAITVQNNELKDMWAVAARHRYAIY